MHPTLKKMNYKGQSEVFIINHPAIFQEVIESLDDKVMVKHEIKKSDKIHFLVAFVTTKKEIDKIIHRITPLLIDDAILWISYPKKSSKNYTSEVSRDVGWEVMKQYDLLPVRAVSIDEDWSSGRFRKKSYIKKLTRKPGTLGT